MFEQLFWTPASVYAWKNMYDPAILAILEIINMITKLIIKKIRILGLNKKLIHSWFLSKYILRVHATLYPLCFGITIYGSLRKISVLIAYLQIPLIHACCVIFYLYPGHPFICVGKQWRLGKSPWVMQQCLLIPLVQKSQTWYISRSIPMPGRFFSSEK